MSSPTTTFPPTDLLPLLSEITTLLTTRHETLSLVETATGGLLSSSLLSLPGASRFHRGGLTLYTLPSREAYAGWTAADTAAYRGPTPAVVAGLARRVRQDLGSTYAVAESGTAGPTGGEARNRRPGYVALAVDWDGGVVTREVETGLGGDRVGNMVRFAVEALRLLRDVMVGEVEGGEVMV
jgi:nicotinamide mononucleotide (NMN) deamidase PncC